MGPFLFTLLLPFLFLTGCKKSHDDGPSIPGTISVSPNQTSLPYEAQLSSVTVTCLNPDGEPNPVATWTLASNQTWLKLSLNADGSEAGATLMGTGTQSVYLVTETNTDFSIRTAKISLNGSQNIVVTVTQNDIISSPNGGISPTETIPYVGAFWRATQTGERVIKINVGSNSVNLGDWSASVAWYDSKWNPAGGDGIVLAAGGSPDPNIYQANPGDAENYKVAGAATTVSSTVAANGDILFRTGLTKPFTAYNEANNPARYAVLVLTYGTPVKMQKLFLRQGEGPDYVMRPGDKNGSDNSVGGVDDRSFARKFSPYNLTDPNGNTQTDFNSMTSTATGLLGADGGRFTDFPTQAGYFFQFNASTRAFHPTTPVGNFANWGQNQGSAYWNVTADETCPAGYRRPRDGNNTTHNAYGPVAGSEMRQSLWLNPQGGDAVNNLDNSVWGYYADGYFDRRQIVASASDYPNTAVATPGAHVAYVGRLFYNPRESSDNYNASLFFPAAGNRDYSYGTLSYTGYQGVYGSSSSNSSLHAWILHVGGDIAQNGVSTRSNGISVRCIRIENII